MGHQTQPPYARNQGKEHAKTHCHMFCMIACKIRFNWWLLSVHVINGTFGRSAERTARTGGSTISSGQPVAFWASTSQGTKIATFTRRELPCLFVFTFKTLYFVPLGTNRQTKVRLINNADGTTEHKWYEYMYVCVYIYINTYVYIYIVCVCILYSLYIYIHIHWILNLLNLPSKPWFKLFHATIRDGAWSLQAATSHRDDIGLWAYFDSDQFSDPCSAL